MKTVATRPPEPGTRLASSTRLQVIAIVGAAVFAAVHLPFLPASLEDLDSINFALGIRVFDVAQHQPHPPGYPLFVAAARLLHALGASETHALALLSVAAGALGLLAAFAFFRRVSEADGSGEEALLATVLVATAPLYWFTAVRPLSDMTGLAAALAVQALTLAAATDGALAAAAFAAALAAGIRSQVAWLTVPLLVWRCVTWMPERRARAAGQAMLAFVAGGLVWGSPLVALTGGPLGYWHALFAQGAEDLSGVRMLWTTPTVRELAAALDYAFVAPWADLVMAPVVLVLAAAGVVKLVRSRSRAFTILSAAFVPYLIFDVVFQETVTTRYSLPLVVPVAYLALSGLMWMPRRFAAVMALALAAYGAHLGGTSVAAFARQPAPAFRLLGDMQAVHGIAPDIEPIMATHRREWFDLRRPIVWTGAAMPALADRLAAPPKHEWLELVKYWNGGGRNLVWFVADPLRTDLALIEHGRPNGSYRWPLPYPVLLGGVRPDGMDWYALESPGWYLGEGWALTPETAGVAKEDRRGPGLSPIHGWVRRGTGPVTLMVGGRNLSNDGPSVHATIAIDGRPIDSPTVPPGFFLELYSLPAGALEGAGDYARIDIAADAPAFAIEQFDARPADRVVFGFGEGWQEQEYKPATGLLWRWMSERAELRVHASGRSVVLTLTGEPPSVYFSKPSHVRVRAGGRVVAEAELYESFAVRAVIPGDLLAGDDATVTIETDQMYVPAERSRRSPDRRHLALRVFDCRIDPVS